jgi:signal transduction histidine kinase
VSAIANQTLRFHKQSSRPQLVSCEDLFESALLIHQGRIVNSGVVVQKRKRATDGVLCFDGEIRQVLNNLLGNAIDAMSAGGGRLLIRSRHATDWESNRKGLMLTVADTGSGMSAATRKKLFDAFFTTKGIGGTGLGLWVSKEIVERHGGSLRVRSSQAEGHQGTVFSLFLPFDAVAR